MDVMEPLGTHDFFQGLSNSTLLDSGFQDDDNKDSLFDLLSQSFPDMILQPYGHLSSLPLDAPDLQLSIQEDYDFQEEAADSADDSILQEFVSEVQNILSDSKRSNVENAPDLCASLPSITPLVSTTDDHFSPVKKMCPDQIDLLMGPLLDDDDDLIIQNKDFSNIQSTPIKQCSNFNSDPKKLECDATDLFLNKTRKHEKSGNSKPAIACVKPIIKTEVTSNSKPLVNIISKSSVHKPSIASMPATRVIKVEEESSDEVDIETVDDDELNGRSGAEVLFAQLANENCQAARVRALPPKVRAVSCLQLPQVKTEASHKAGFDHSIQEKIQTSHKTGLDQSVPAKSSPPAAPSFPPMVKPITKPKEKEPSPSSVVEKIRQSVVTPRTSILIPHQAPPLPRGKSVKQEKVKSISNDSASTCPSPYDARTLDHDYCNKNFVEQVSVSPVSVNTQNLRTNTSSDVCVEEENKILVSDIHVPVMGAEISLHMTLKEESLESEDHKSCDLPVNTSKPPQKEAMVPVVKTERELPLSYRNWHRSPSPYNQTRCKKRGSRRRSSCSPSSVSSHSIYRSRSRSLSRGRKSRTQTYQRRKHSKGNKSRSHRSIKRSRYTYSRSSSRSSFSSRSSSSSSSRSRSRSCSRSCSRSRSRSRSWDYKRIYNRAPVTKYAWPQEKRHYNDGKSQQIEERRVVYVGRLPDGTTKNDLRHRFGCFGPIQEVSVHFRDSGHNYGFVTFSYKRDAYEAVEHGNDDPNLPKFDLSFGGRRQFCQQRYSDLDSQYNYPVQRSTATNDFDSLLRAAKLKMKKKY